MKNEKGKITVELNYRTPKEGKALEFGIKKILEDNKNETPDLILKKINMYFEKIQELFDKKEMEKEINEIHDSIHNE